MERNQVAHPGGGAVVSNDDRQDGALVDDEWTVGDRLHQVPPRFLDPSYLSWVGPRNPGFRGIPVSPIR